MQQYLHAINLWWSGDYHPAFRLFCGLSRIHQAQLSTSLYRCHPTYYSFLWKMCSFQLHTKENLQLWHKRNYLQRLSILFSAYQAWTILTSISFCIDRIEETRYFNVPTTFNLFLCWVVRSSLVWFSNMYFVFLSLTCRPTASDAAFNSNKRICASSRVLESSARSSTKSVSVI